MFLRFYKGLLFFGKLKIIEGIKIVEVISLRSKQLATQNFISFQMHDNYLSSYPPAEEVKQFWNSCVSVVKMPDVVRWLEQDRGLNALAIDRQDSVRVITDKTKIPSWARIRPRDGEMRSLSWRDGNYIIIFPLIDHLGCLRSVIARSPSNRVSVKSLSPIGYDKKGLCFLSFFDRVMIDRGESPEDWLIVEGEMDFLTWQMNLAKNIGNTPALLGIFSGSFNFHWGNLLTRLGPFDIQPKVYLRLHHDKAGQKYSENIYKIIKPISQNVEIWRSGYCGYKDENDCLLSGNLVDNFRFECEIFNFNLNNTNEEKANQNKNFKLDNEDSDWDYWARDYVKNALYCAAREIERQFKGSRNNALFKNAVSIARFFHTPYFDITEWRNVLTQAARSVGMESKEIALTLKSALNAARVDPQNFNIPKRRNFNKLKKR